MLVGFEEGMLDVAGLVPSDCLITAWKVYPSESLSVSRGVSSLRIFPVLEADDTFVDKFDVWDR